MRDRVARVRATLPDDIDEPVVSKIEADAQPIIYLAFSSDRHSPLDVTDVADRLVQDRLQTLPGVADVPIYGERRYAMRIWLDPARLAAFRMTTQDVEDALRRQNVEVPAGRIESRMREFTVRLRDRPADARAVRGHHPRQRRRLSGAAARMSAGPSSAPPTTASSPATTARARWRSASSSSRPPIPLEVSNAVRAALPEIERMLPEGMQLDVAYDSSIFIARSIDEVFIDHRRGDGAGHGRHLPVPALAARDGDPARHHPGLADRQLRAHATLFGFSINTLTLLAMVLAIGLVVDDAIVVLENIHRHVEEGLPPLRAAFKGVREIGFAVVAMTLTLAAVFAPFAFATGHTDRLFVEFALTLAGAVVISGLRRPHAVAGDVRAHAEAPATGTTGCTTCSSAASAA